MEEKEITDLVIELLNERRDEINRLYKNGDNQNIAYNMGGFSFSEYQTGKRDELLIRIERRKAD